MCKTVLSANIQSENFFSTFEVRKVCVFSTLMLSKLLAAERKKKEEMKDREAARKRTVKQTEKPLALAVKAKWLSNVNTTAHDMDIDWRRLTAAFYHVALTTLMHFQLRWLQKTHTYYNNTMMTSSVTKYMPSLTLLAIILFAFPCSLLSFFSSYLLIHLSLMSLKKICILDTIDHNLTSNQRILFKIDMYSAQYMTCIHIEFNRDWTSFRFIFCC